MNQTIEAKNREFDNLPAYQKRVSIARDVLAQLRSGLIEAQQGVYLLARLRNREAEHDYVQGDEQVCDVLAETKCRVCGIGGLFLSAVQLFDKLKVGDMSGSRFSVFGGVSIDGVEAKRYLEQFFSSEQLKLIEQAFERFENTIGSHFAPHVEDASERLRLIMENIVANRGQFVPEIQPTPVAIATIQWKTAGFVC